MGEDEALTDHPMRNLSEGIRKQVTWLSSWHGNEVMKVQRCEGMRTCVNCGESGAWSWQWVLKSKATPDWFNKRWICLCCLCVAKSMNYIFIDSIQGKKSFQIFKLLKSLANSFEAPKSSSWNCSITGFICERDLEAFPAMYNSIFRSSYTLSNVCVLNCVWLCNPMDCSPPGSSVHGIFQARNWSGLPFPSSTKHYKWSKMQNVIK